jgi:hypothetical protein
MLQPYPIIFTKLAAIQASNKHFCLKSHQPTSNFINVNAPLFKARIDFIKNKEFKEVF